MNTFRVTFLSAPVNERLRCPVLSSIYVASLVDCELLRCRVGFPGTIEDGSMSTAESPTRCVPQPRVGLRTELCPFLLQLLAELAKVRDDTVVHDGETVDGIRVYALFAVGRP